MVKTNVLKELGYFNEEYFFCPEDIELSTIANKKGKKCYVNSNIIIYHRQGSTSTLTSLATFPSMYKGFSIFYKKYFKRYQIFVDFILIISLARNYIFWMIKNNEINKLRNKNSIKALFMQKTTKEIFKEFYNEINNEK
jgi:GT2 family glycosyltransferase